MTAQIVVRQATVTDSLIRERRTHEALVAVDEHIDDAVVTLVSHGAGTRKD